MKCWGKGKLSKGKAEERDTFCISHWCLSGAYSQTQLLSRQLQNVHVGNLSLRQNWNLEIPSEGDIQQSLL